MTATQARRRPVSMRDLEPLHPQWIGGWQPDLPLFHPWIPQLARRVLVVPPLAALVIAAGATAGIVTLTICGVALLVLAALWWSDQQRTFELVTQHGDPAPCARYRRTALRRAGGSLTIVGAILIVAAITFPGVGAFAAVLALPILLRALVPLFGGDLDLDVVPCAVRRGERFVVRLGIGRNAAVVRRVEVVLLCATWKDRILDPPLIERLAEDLAILHKLEELPTQGGAVEIPFRIPFDAPSTAAHHTNGPRWHVFVRVWSGFGSYIEHFDAPVVIDGSASVDETETG